MKFVKSELNVRPSDELEETAQAEANAEEEGQTPSISSLLHSHNSENQKVEDGKDTK